MWLGGCGFEPPSIPRPSRSRTLTCTHGSLGTLHPSSRVADVRGEIIAIYISPDGRGQLNDLTDPQTCLQIPSGGCAYSLRRGEQPSTLSSAPRQRPRQGYLSRQVRPSTDIKSVAQHPSIRQIHGSRCASSAQKKDSFNRRQSSRREDCAITHCIIVA